MEGWVNVCHPIGSRDRHTRGLVKFLLAPSRKGSPNQIIIKRVSDRDCPETTESTGSTRGHLIGSSIHHVGEEAKVCFSLFVEGV